MSPQKTAYYYGLVAITTCLFLWLAHAIDGELTRHPALIPRFLTHMLPSLHGMLILGLGLGLPLMLISAILGWGQLLLLMHGQISPHLARKA